MTTNNENQMIPFESDLDLEELENQIAAQLEAQFADLELLEQERAAISDPESFGKVVLDSVWNQFANQIGLELTNETLTQKYDREHPEDYKDIADSVMQDKRYREANKAMKDSQQSGKLTDAYTGKPLKPGEKANLDHVVSRKEIYENRRRKQANLGVAELANKPENLKPTNENLNKSKKEQSVKEYLANREIRERSQLEQYERAKQKIEASNMSDAEKRLQKKKKKKALDNKLAADDDLMIQADKEARRAINIDIRKQAAKQIGKKATKDSLKTMAVTALSAMLKEIVNALVRFFKEKSRSFRTFLSEMKAAIKSFFSKIFSVIKTGASTFVGTIITEIFAPIARLFERLTSLIKQGAAVLIDAVNFLRDAKNRDMPFSVKAAEVGKLIAVGLAGGGMFLLHEVFEKLLLSIPGLQVMIPGIGTLANMISLFLSGLLSGIVGALVLKWIDKFISRRLKEESDKQIIKKKNQILTLQQTQVAVAEHRVEESKQNAFYEIKQNHAEAQDVMRQTLQRIFDDSKDEHAEIAKMGHINQSDLAQMQKELQELLGDEE